ncbi:TPA: fucose isomerase [Candidatus Sumerlaeota bacterium]|jgi:L-fucose isomerase-like protein|nr:fucose isomerase [Candidatus Sumerlaeota bacterium]
MTTLGIIVGNRGFFPDHLCESGRKTILDILKSLGIKAVLLDTNATAKFGSCETYADSVKCAELFKKNREKIDGILVTLPNFGDERAVADSIRLAGLNVPVLVHAFSDDAEHMTVKNRRDSFCGKMSVCNNLRQYGIPYSLTSLHTMDPNTDAFKNDLRKFASVCNVVKGFKNARFGQIGTRPPNFTTVRYSEKLFEQSGITVVPVDLSEIMGWANGMKDGDAAVKEKLDAFKAYTDTKAVSATGLMKMSKLGVAIDKWSADNAISATSIQCWTSLEEFYGVVPCTYMSMLSNSLHASACEADIAGLVGMVALQNASGTPSALLDWNNNYGDDPDKGMVFHCSNLPKAFFESHKMEYQAIIAGTVGKENTYGTICGRIKAGPFSYCRVSTDDITGQICAYLGEGCFTDDAINTFGGYGVIYIPELQKLLKHICTYGFEHHVACSLSQTADAVNEALTNYMNWDVYHHAAE